MIYPRFKPFLNMVGTFRGTYNTTSMCHSFHILSIKSGPTWFNSWWSTPLMISICNDLNQACLFDFAIKHWYLVISELNLTIEQCVYIVLMLTISAWWSNAYCLIIQNKTIISSYYYFDEKLRLLTPII